METLIGLIVLIYVIGSEIHNRKSKAERVRVGYIEAIFNSPKERLTLLIIILFGIIFLYNILNLIASF